MATEIDFGKLELMGDDEAIISRMEPVNMAGFLERKQLPVTLEYLQERFGGGQYRLAVTSMHDNRSRIRGSKIVTVSGPSQTKVDILDQMSSGERVKTIREMGRRLRKYCPEAADYMEVYDEPRKF